jgi:glycosyltransferase involved in cell wall biosynthesis
MIENAPLISIIMNCYNGEKYLREAINSVYAQTYQNWEIIFWDNASNDTSGDIAKSYDSKLKYYYAKKNTKLYEARNYALDKCSGEYVAFLDCDDVWLTNKIQLQMQYIKSNNVQIVATSYSVVGYDLSLLRNVYMSSCKWGFTGLLNYNYISISSVLIRSSVIKKLRFNQVFQLIGDLDLWLRFSMDNEIGGVNEVCQLSRQHKNNTSLIDCKMWRTERRYMCYELLKKNDIDLVKALHIIKYLIKKEVSELKKMKNNL